MRVIRTVCLGEAAVRVTAEGYRVVQARDGCYTAEAHFLLRAHSLQSRGRFSPREVNTLKAYELMLIIDPTLDEDARSALLDKVQGLVTAQGGTVDSVESWGKRRLAFEIGGFSDGDYAVLQFHATAASIAELDRVLHITDPVVRFMVVRRDDLA
jgi:small subunit ribosomal protein S6